MATCSYALLPIKPTVFLPIAMALVYHMNVSPSQLESDSQPRMLFNLNYYRGAEDEKNEPGEKQIHWHLNHPAKISP